MLWRAGALTALGAEADGIMDAAARPLRDFRPPAGAPLERGSRASGRVHRALDALEAEAGDFGNTGVIGTITITRAGYWIPLRHEGWRATRPKLAAWFEWFGKRPSMARTAPAEIR
jgi:glutathione S-transferase